MATLFGYKLPHGIELRAVLTGTALFTAGLVVRGFFVNSARPGVIQSPRATLLPKLTKKEISELPYPPDALPGSRDIDSPFGSIRAYEFGPEDGRKVLLVHGISTPCLALGGLAHTLADKGCRVLLFDLPGRGYSDTPSDLRHDMRLLTSLVMLVLATSPLSWTGSSANGFSMIGYSLGGGISASFTSFFPDLINSLVLIAPAGLIRPHHISRTSRILYSEGVVPEPILNRLVKKRLQKPLYPPKEQPDKGEKTGVAQAVKAEVNIEGNQNVVLSKKHPEITIERAVNHQLLHHQGFVQAFMSSMRYGPVQNQHEQWRRIGKRLSNKTGGYAGDSGKVLIVLGRLDPIIDVDEVSEDATELLEGNVEFRVFEAGHEVPFSKGEQVAEVIWDFWNGEQA